MKNSMFRYAWLLLLFFLPACDEKDPGTSPLLWPGTYEGTFYRWSPADPDPAIANVHLSFRDGMFSGGSNTARYPAICNGKYAVSGSEVVFTNFCAWTADFDWTIILDGKFTVSEDAGYVRLTQREGDSLEVYRLKRNSVN